MAEHETDLSELETPTMSKMAEKNQEIARRVLDLRQHSTYSVYPHTLGNLATLKRPIMLYTLPSKGNSENLGEEYRPCNQGERYGQDWQLGHYTLGSKQITISYMADPTFPSLKMIANFRIGNFLRPNIGEHGIFLRLASVFADERLMEEESETRLQFLIRQLASQDVILTRRYGQGDRFTLDVNDPELSTRHMGVGLEIRRDMLSLLENVGYLENVRTNAEIPLHGRTVYAMMKDDTFRYGEHPQSVEAFGSPAKARNSTNHYLLQTPLCCMQTASELCFGNMYLFCEVCKKRKTYVDFAVNDDCRDYRKDNDPRAHRMRIKPEWRCPDCKVSGK